MNIRPYDPESDREDCLRIYKEIGWSDGSEDERRAAEMNRQSGRTLVAELNGAVEGFASTENGAIRYLDAILPTCIVAGVGTGLVARRLGFAKQLTAEAIAADVIEKGHAVAVLGMFDQGFYDHLGFGTGAPDTMVAFDPKDLEVPPPSRPPIRLGLDDWERVHAGRLTSMRRHGTLALDDPATTHSEMLIHSKRNGFGLGFEDEHGALTHHVWLTSENMGEGPCWVRWMAFRNGAELMDLLGVLHGLADQMQLIRIVEPHWIQIWDLLKRPWRRRSLSIGSKHEAVTRSLPWWQVRICDLERCVSAVQLATREALRFNLVLNDPIRGRLSEDTAAQWPGLTGNYVVSLGPESSAEAGAEDPALPTLRASVNDFSRLWLGVLPAGGLAMTSSTFEAPAELVDRLDRTWCLPRPWLGWDI